MDKKYNGFASEEQYLKALEMLKEIQEVIDTYDREYLSVTKEDDYIEFTIDKYSIRIWDDCVEVYILDEKRLHLVDNGIMNVCKTILDNLQEGTLDFMFNLE